MAIGHFLGGIGAVIWSVKTGKYLLLRRVMSKDFTPGVWECVTGRVEQGESFSDALVRETYEELGVVVNPRVIVGTTHFYRGDVQPENELLGVIYGCELEENQTITLDEEHDAMVWVTYEQALTMLQVEDPSTQWLRRILQHTETIRGLIPDALILYRREVGFEFG
jgi:8-oxo-dGTP diphosphatase